MMTYRTDYDKISKIIIPFIKKFSHNKMVVLGLSGGIDSALCGVLAYKALGKKKIHILLTPSRYTPEADVKDALDLAKKISSKVRYISRDKLEEMRKSFDKAIASPGESENIIIDAYIRNDLLRRYARLNNFRMLGTINGTEWKLGYYPKYSLIGDLLPIADLYKSQIFELSRYIGVPARICEKIPTLSLGCAPDVKEEKLSHVDKELIKSKLTFKELDKILVGFNKHLTPKEIVKHGEGKITLRQVKIVQALLTRQKHKTKLPPYPKINNY